MINSFKGKKILITGASKGLGLEISKEFANSGASLALVSRSEDLLKNLVNEFENKNEHLIYSKDLLIKEELKLVVEDIKKKFNSLDIIIHCIGGSFGKNDPLSNWSDFEYSLRGNLGIAVDINKEFIPNMKELGGGNIIHVSSIVSQQATASPFYCSAKSALNGYVRSMGNFLVKDKIYLSGIIPGAFIAEGNAMSRYKFYKPEEYTNFVNSLPQKEMPHALEYIEIIKLLSSRKARIFAGSLINLDSGQGISIY